MNETSFTAFENDQAFEAFCQRIAEIYAKTIDVRGGFESVDQQLQQKIGTTNIKAIYIDGSDEE